MGNTNDSKIQLYNPVERKQSPNLEAKKWDDIELPDHPQPPTHLRKWVHANNNNSNNGDDDQKKDSYQFRVVQYNILASCYAGIDRYHYCHPKILGEDYRRKNIVSEINSYSGDFICLQEVEPSTFDFLSKSLKNYTGKFEKRNTGFEGLCIFWREDTTNLVKYCVLRFDGLIESPKQSPHRYLTHNIAMLCVFETNVLKKNSSEGSSFLSKTREKKLICVVNTHLYWDPQKSDLKILQSLALIEHLHRFLDQNFPQYKENPSSIPVIFSGDFNSMPTSGAFDLIKIGKIPNSHPDMRGYYKRKSIGIPKEYAGRLSSSYEIVDHPWTNFTPTFSGCIDYIWHTNDNLSLVKVLEPLSLGFYTREGGGLPNKHWSSDHISIVADFNFNDQFDPNATTSTSTSSSTTITISSNNNDDSDKNNDNGEESMSIEEKSSNRKE